MLTLSGKTALVTGASRRLGRAIALALGKAGANVAVTDLLVESEKADKESPAECSLLATHFAGSGNVQTVSTAQEIGKMGVIIIGLKMDVTRPDDIKKVVSEVSGQIGDVDILVNNASVMDNLALME